MYPDIARKWLLAVDGSTCSHRAAGYVARWAPILGVTEVFVLNVQPIGSFRAYALHRNEALLEAQSQGRQASEVARRILSDARIPHRFHTVIGSSPAEAILNQAAAEQASEIVLGSRGLTPLAGAALGSVAYKVVHNANLPVTVAGNQPLEAGQVGHEGDAVQRVLLAVDGSECSHAAAKYLCGFADGGCRVEAVLVNVQLPMLGGDTRHFVAQEAVDSACRTDGENALQVAKSTLTQSGIRFDTRVMTGAVAETIVQLAERHACHRIVMGTRGLGALGAVTLGSAAYKVVHLATMPVTLIR